MDMLQLETFVAVAEERNFSRAALRLHRTQPAVSQAIRKLELSVGEPLFDRSSRDGHLTDAGRLLHAYAEKLLNLREEARSELKELKHLHRGRLTVAANEFSSLYLVRVLEEYRRLHPMIKITVQRSLASRISQEVLSHKVELGVVSFQPEEPELRSIVIYRDELAFVVHPRHPLAQETEVSIKRLGAESFVAHIVPSPHRVKVIDTFRRHNTPLHMDVELPTLDSIRKFVADGNGVALLPGIAVEDDLARGALVRVKIRELVLERKLRVIYRKDSPLSHAGRALLKIMEHHSKGQNGNFLFQRAKA
jgi:DNA-binding transcriptional LysR family regulator